jgi:hypothetical protein
MLCTNYGSGTTLKRILRLRTYGIYKSSNRLYVLGNPIPTYLTYHRPLSKPKEKRTKPLPCSSILFTPFSSSPSPTSHHCPQNVIHQTPLHTLLLHPTLRLASLQRRPLRRRRRHLPWRQILARLSQDPWNRPVPTQRRRGAEYRHCRLVREGARDEG